MAAPKMQKFDIIIIGGGAAGLIAALQAKYEAPHLSVAVLEKEARPGRKLLATGNGRCNIANSRAAKEHYFNSAGDNPAFVQAALKAYPVADNLAFFRDMGLLTKEEADGKMYPLGDQAAAVLDTLRLHIAAKQVALITETEVLGINKQLQIRTNNGDFAAGAVILALGGVASPKLSTSGNFAEMLKPLGHRTTPLYPALCQIKTESPIPKALQGIKFVGRAEIWQQNQLLGAEEGEILFAAYGVSGPPILQLSRLSATDYPNPPSIPQEIRLDILPNMTEEEIAAELLRRQKLPLTLEDYLTGMLNKRLGQQMIKLATPRKLSEPAESLTGDEIKRLAHLLKCLPLPISGVTGWQQAQVMAGGLELKGFTAQNLASRLVPGLFAAGEVLDICGACGGYNLTWAWSSGRLAAHSAVNLLQKGR